MIDENALWLLSFYRNSEISGALFFGKVAQVLRDPVIQKDLTKHFADESQHAWLWTKAIHDLDQKPIRLSNAYQDRYLSTAGMPVNLMEVLAITQVFEKRVIGQYARHRTLKNIHPVVSNTLDLIMEDEKWHIQWIDEALQSMEKDYGVDRIKATLKRFHEADQEVYGNIMKEHHERLNEFARKEQ